MTQAVLFASFGTTKEDAIERTIVPIEQELAALSPDAHIIRVFTSGMIRGILAKKGVEVFDPEEAFDHAHALGCKSVLIVSSHLLYGAEYNKLAAVAKIKEDLFEEVRMSAPLLATIEDYRFVLRMLAEENPVAGGQALVLMGHGTTHRFDPTYCALEYEAHDLGLDHVFIGTVEGYPTCSDVIRHVKAAGFSKALITPLLYVAGVHARDDMAGEDPDSWKSQFESAGIDSTCLVKGLGEYEQIRQLYREHAAVAPLADEQVFF